MVEITTLRIWIGITAVWPLFWMLVFDRWFFLSPFGLLIALGIPVAGWVYWWNFYRGEDEKLAADSKLIVDKSRVALGNLKKRISSQ